MGEGGEREGEGEGEEEQEKVRVTEKRRTNLGEQKKLPHELFSPTLLPGFLFDRQHVDT